MCTLIVHIVQCITLYIGQFFPSRPSESTTNCMLPRFHLTRRLVVCLIFMRLQKWGNRSFLSQVRRTHPHPLRVACQCIPDNSLIPIFNFQSPRTKGKQETRNMWVDRSLTLSFLSFLPLSTAFITLSSSLSRQNSLSIVLMSCSVERRFLCKEESFYVAL